MNHILWFILVAIGNALCFNNRLDANALIAGWPHSKIFASVQLQDQKAQMVLFDIHEAELQDSMIVFSHNASESWLAMCDSSNLLFHPNQSAPIRQAPKLLFRMCNPP